MLYKKKTNKLTWAWPRENSEYDQEITQSQKFCRHTHGTARKSHTAIMRHQEDKLSKATSSLFLILMHMSSKDENQPVHPSSLISAFVIHTLEGVSYFL